MLQLKQKLKSDFFKNISTLISGTLIAQLIPIILQPILRRFYSPELFGAYTVYLSLVGILIVVTSLRYELAIIYPKEDKKAVSLLFLAQFFNMIFCTVLFICICLFKSAILSFLNLSEKYSLFLYLVPLGTFLYNLYQSFNYWLIRKKSFLNISFNKIIRRSTEGSMQILFKTIKIPNGLLIGDILGHFANNISALFQVSKKGLFKMPIKRDTICKVIDEYIEYPKYNLVPAFMSTVSFLLPAILINKFYGTQQAGYFDLSKLVLSIPLALVATSISNVLMQRITEKDKMNKSIKNDLIAIFGVVSSIALIELLVILFWGDSLFVFIFGQKWHMAGKMSILLVPSFALSFVVSSFSSLFISLKKIKALSLWQLFYFSSILSLWFLNKLELISFIRIYVAIELLCFSINLIIMVIIVIKYERSIHLVK